MPHTALRQLVLIPQQADWRAASQTAFVQQLQGLGVLGAALVRAPDCFLIGENFLQQFSFMGCAPNLAFAPADAADWRPDEFVYVHIHATSTAPRWFADTLLGKPACPHCRKRNTGWRTHYNENRHAIECQYCGAIAEVCMWRWFDAGGCASQFISIVNVYPKESIPTDTLLQDLATLSGVAWTYFYLHAPFVSVDDAQIKSV